MKTHRLFFLGLHLIKFHLCLFLALVAGAGSGSALAAGMALQLDGIDDEVTIAAPKLPVHDNFTIEAWVRSSAQQEVGVMRPNGVDGCRGQRYFVTPQNTNQQAYAGAGVSIGANCIGVYEHTNNYLPALLVYSIDLTHWTHIAIVYQDRQATLYVNGQFALRGLKSPMRAVALSFGPIGGFAYGHMSGTVDEIRFWSRSLSAEEILANMNQHLRGDEQGLVLYYDCDKMSSDGRIEDLSGNGCKGTLTGGALLVASDRLVESSLAGVGISELSGKATVSQGSDPERLLLRESVTSAPGPAHGAGMAIKLDGIDDAVPVAAGEWKEITNDFTIEAWVRPAATQANSNMSQGNCDGIHGQRYLLFPWLAKLSNTAGVGLSVGTNGVSVFEHAPNYMPALLTHSVVINDWTHIAVVYEDRQPALYIDGVFVMRGLRSPRSVVHLHPESVAWAAAGYGAYSGLVDELKLWQRALSPEEIQSQVHQPMAGAEEGLFLYYDFNEMSSDGYIRDLTGHGHKGALNGGALLVPSTCPIKGPVAVAIQKVTAEYTMPARPADLTIDSIFFSESSGNRALEGYEIGQIRMVLANRGLGEAQNVQLTLAPLGDGSGLEFEKKRIIERIAAKSHQEVIIPITAAGSVVSLARNIRLQASEEFGFDADPVTLSFETVAYNPPDLQIPKVAIYDKEEGDAYGNGNSVVEPNESVIVTAFVQNFGSGAAEQTKARVRLNTDSPYLSCPDTAQTFDLGSIEPGDYREVKFYFFSTKRFSGEAIPLSLELTEAKGDYGKTVDLGLKMNVRTENIVDVSIARVSTPKPEIREIAGFSKSDVDDLPVRSQTSRPNGLAVVIGIEDYKYAPEATYASRDAEAFYNYAVQVLGIPDANIYYQVNDGATVGEFMKLFDEGGWLSRRVTPESEVFVFYSGHGAPDMVTKNPYLIPYDVDPNYANKGYSALVMYENLGKLGAKSVTVMLDACFSGQDREDKMLLADARPVRISAGVAGVPENVTVLSASSGDEISSSYPEQRHGIFSYYLMKGLGGSADGDANHLITIQELYDYVITAVKRTAGQVDRLQTPQLVVQDGNSVVVEY